MAFRISGLPAAPFAHLFGLDDNALAEFGAIRYIADCKPGFPCRVTLEDVEPGDRVLLLHYVHQPANTPYRASHAIFVREGASLTASFIDEVPASLRTRLLSVRAFDANDMLVDADIIVGADLEALVARFFSKQVISYLHVHNAKAGCYAARVDRFESSTIDATA
ncbi:MAG TPA: DUF1203 domain-containing protein [Candidatus Acidoferrales bacterium]|nr:DUF1203 domain-containing protein [Candidatus Acidoferrales bacterium]